MSGTKLQTLARSYWHVALIVVAALAALVFAVNHYQELGKDPVDLLRQYGYVVILVWTFLEGETIVIIAGWASASIGLKPWLIALCAFVGSFASDQVMFSLGKYKGEKALRYFPRIAGRVDKAAALFKKYDVALILGFRFVYGVRNITPILLGISGVSHLKFFALNFIGAAVWAVTFTYGGLYVGKAFMAVMARVGGGILSALLGVAVIAGFLWYLRSRASVRRAIEIRDRSKDEQEEGQPVCKKAEGNAAGNAQERSAQDASSMEK